LDAFLEEYRRRHGIVRAAVLTMKNLARFTVVFLLIAGTTIAAMAQTAKDDAKDAGHSAIQAAKDAGKASKKTAKSTAHKVKKGTKKAVNKSAQETEEGADKVKEKTK
jgi:hypothetical protein